MCDRNIDTTCYGSPVLGQPQGLPLQTSITRVRSNKGVVQRRAAPTDVDHTIGGFRIIHPIRRGIPIMPKLRCIRDPPTLREAPHPVNPSPQTATHQTLRVHQTPF
ncbi:hypothetical protein L6R29_21165 [Myxococcota bacterium]|nr:hypothetical protein [Myxococcota bacterium]